MPLHVNYTFLNNATIILDCLTSSDLQTARRLYEDVMHLDGGINYQKIDSVDTLRKVLSRIKVDCSKGMLPIIHIEAHGDSNKGIQVGDKKDVFSWKELVDSLREINILTKNNTVVILAACEGLYAILQIRIFQPTPFAFLIGSQDKISAGDLDKHMVKFYSTLVKTGSAAVAMKEIPDRMQLFHSEQFFLIAIGRHFKQYMGKRFLKNTEKMISKTRRFHNRHSLRELRAALKPELKPSQARFAEYARKFLHGKITVEFEDFMAFLRGELRNNTPR